MDADLISVIVPSLNHRAFIGAAIESIFHQTYPAIEIIVVDDGSTDGTPAWLRQVYGTRITQLVTQENLGAHSAINEGMGVARGRYLAILDSDDVFVPTRLSTLVEAIRLNSWDIAFSNLIFVGADGRALTKGSVNASYSRKLEQFSNSSAEEALVCENIAITTSNFIAKRELFDQVGKFRGLRYCHDWDFLLRCVGRCKIGWLREPLLHYRLHEHNTIHEGKGWRLSTENALVYVLFLLEGKGNYLALTGNRVLDSESLEPLVVTWLFAEARRVGPEELLRQAESGELHHRVGEALNKLRVPSGFSARRILKRIRKSRLAALFRL